MMPETIRTGRLVLRPWAFDDVAAVLDYALDEEWGRYLPVPVPYREVDARQFIAAQVLHDWRRHASWVIELDGRAVGGINIWFVAGHRIAEFGYSIARSLWGRGLVPEAARAVIRHAFETHPQLERVRAMTDGRNVASQRVLEKIGMRREGLLRRNRLNRDELVDEAWFGMLRSEWIDAQANAGPAGWDPDQGAEDRSMG